MTLVEEILETLKRDYELRSKKVKVITLNRNEANLILSATDIERIVDLIDWDQHKKLSVEHQCLVDCFRSLKEQQTLRIIRGDKTTTDGIGPLGPKALKGEYEY